MLTATGLGTGCCQCGRTISHNKTACGTCASKPQGRIDILNVQGGDMRITFDNANPIELIRAKRIIMDMLRRGYALVVEVERDGEKKYERVQAFDETRGEYIIADLESHNVEYPTTISPSPDLGENPSPLPPSKEDLCKCGRPAKHRGACRKTARLPMSETKATAIGRSAGG